MSADARATIAEVRDTLDRLLRVAEGLVAREGFPHWDPDRFIRFFREHMRCKPDTEVTRIEWRYVGDEGQ